MCKIVWQYGTQTVPPCWPLDTGTHDDLYIIEYDLKWCFQQENKQKLK